LTCGLLALIAIGAAAFLLIRTEQHITERAASLRSFDQHARDASDALVDARVGQQAYVAAGQGVDFWFGKTAAAIQSATEGLTTLHESAGAGARTAIDQAVESVTEFSGIDKRARDYLKSGEQLMAGDVIFTEGSDAAATAVRQIETARQAEHQAADVDEAAVRKQQTLTAAAAAGVVVLLVLLLIPVPRRTEAVTATATRPSLGLSAPVVDDIPDMQAHAVVVKPQPPEPAVAPAAPTAHAQGVVLKAATGVVTDFGRVRDINDLTTVLARAADVMDASGLMVWMGSAAGTDLRPVLAHGYSADMIARIPPVARGADNAAAAAYRSGTLQIVHSRPGGSAGAVVAPILTADGCIGALSGEIRSGGEGSESVQALAAIFAAQLASVLSTAPAAATADIEAVEPRAAAVNS